MATIFDDIDDAIGKGLGLAAKIILALVALSIISSFVFGFGPGAILQRVFSPTAVVSNYEWFEGQYQAIEAQRANLAAMPADAPERRGLLMVLNNSIAEYNARSRQITRSLWKSSELPYQIPLSKGD